MNADPPAGSDASDIFALAVRLRTNRQAFALATVVAAEGSTSAVPGAKAIFDREGAVLAGWVGGGCADATVAHAAIESIERERGEIVELDLNDDVLGTGMPCGGTMKVFVEPVLPKPVLWILGHGRVAECLCGLGALMGFDVVVHDPLADESRFPQASRIVAEDVAYEALQPRSTDFVVIATQHKGDHQSMARILGSEVDYIALMASHKRAALVLDHLRAAGFDDAALARVRAPAGLDLGAASPEEIALSIMAEVVLVRRKGPASAKARSLGRGPQTVAGAASPAVKNAAAAMTQLEKAKA